MTKKDIYRAHRGWNIGIFNKGTFIKRAPGTNKYKNKKTATRALERITSRG